MANGDNGNDDNNENGRIPTRKRIVRDRASSSDSIGIVGHSDDDNVDGENTELRNGTESIAGESRTGDDIPLFANLRNGSAESRGDRGSHPGDSRSHPAGSASSAEEIEIAIGSSVPRHVKSSELGSSGKKGKSETSPEFFAECWSIAFSAAAASFGDSEWKIDDDDASELGTRTAKLVNSLDQKKSGKWIRKFQKHQPALSLLMAVAMIATPRIKRTKDRRKNGRIQPKGQNQNVASDGSAQLSVQETGNGNAGMGDATGAFDAEFRQVDTNTGIPGTHGLSVNKQDSAILFSRPQRRKM